MVAFTPTLARARVDVRRVHEYAAYAYTPCKYIRSQAACVRTRTLQGGVNLAGRPVSIAAETLPDHQSRKCSCGKWLPARRASCARCAHPLSSVFLSSPHSVTLLSLLLSLYSFLRESLSFKTRIYTECLDICDIYPDDGSSSLLGKRRFLFKTWWETATFFCIKYLEK